MEPSSKCFLKPQKACQIVITIQLLKCYVDSVLLYGVETSILNRYNNKTLSFGTKILWNENNNKRRIKCRRRCSKRKNELKIKKEKKTIYCKYSIYLKNNSYLFDKIKKLLFWKHNRI